MTAPKVGLIVFHADTEKFYEPRWIDRFVESIKGQTYFPPRQDAVYLFELDYGQTPEPFLLARESSSTAWHWPMPNHADAQNFLLDQAFIVHGCDYVFNSNVDDFYAPQWMEAQLAFLEQGYDLVSSDWAWVGEDDAVRADMRFSDRDLRSELRAGHNIICHPGVAYSRRFWEGCSRYRNNELPAEDMLLWQREMDRCRYVIVPQLLCYHRHHPRSVSERP